MKTENFEVEHMLLKIGDVLKITRLGRSTLYNLIQTGEFPKPVKLSKNTSTWVASEVTAFVEKRMKERRLTS